MDLQTAVSALLEHTGVGAKLAATEEARRKAVVSETRAKKRANEMKKLDERVRLQAQLSAAEDEEKLAKKAIEDARRKATTLREKFSQNHDELVGANLEFDATLRANAHPAIAAFADELAAIKAAATTPDRIRAIVEAMEALGRLRVDFNTDDDAAEIARIRKNIPAEA
jgi:hypothetical protein